MKLYKLLFVSLLISFSANAQYIYPPNIVSPIKAAGCQGSRNFNLVWNKLAYTAALNSPTAGRRWWSFDGTTATEAPQMSSGGVCLVDLKPYGNYISVLNNDIYFVGHDSAGTTGTELYKWDGTNAPVLVADVCVGKCGTDMTDLTIAKNKLYYRDNSPTRVYEYDPSTNTNKEVQNLLSSGSIETICGHLDKLYISTKGSGIIEYNPGVGKKTISGAMASNSDFLPYGSNLFFVERASTGEGPLWFYNGVTSQSKAKSIKVHTSYLHMEMRKYIYPWKGKIYFWGSSASVSSKSDMYCYDTLSGTTSQVLQAKTINKNEDNFFVGGTDSALFYCVSDSMLLRYNGTRIDTVLPFSFHPHGVATYNNEVYLSGAIQPGDVALMVYKFKDSVVKTIPSGIEIQSATFNANVKLYPNPTGADAYISISLQQAATIAASVTDMAGRQVYSNNPVLYSAGESKIILHLNDVPAGSYVVLLKDNNGRPLWSSKLLKQ